jgi:uncharacterized caspase-like protein
MRRALTCLVALIALLSLALPSRSKAEPVEKRIALVIGNGTYQAGTLHTAVNDAGLIAQTLQAAGFDVTGARDLDQESLRRALREFLEKASNAGPGTVAFVYLSGYGLQLEGENYFLPVDARIGSPAAIPADAIRLSDYIRPLGALELKQSIFVLDAARQNPFSISGEPLAGRLALAEPNSGMLIAFNAAPGTVAPEQNGPYGAYAQALAEMMREGGLSLSDVFERVRLRVSELTKGAEIPRNASRSETSFVFFERSPDAPSPVAETEQNAAVRSRPLAALGASDAYTAAVDRDTLPAYQEFLAAYPDDPMARRVHAIIAARREAIIWRETYVADTPQAYWSYLRLYPRGPHCADARRRLALRAAASEPPASFVEIDYDVPSPALDEQIYIERPALVLDVTEFLPPPPLPMYFLPPPPPEFIVLAPPVPPIEAFVLPIPVFVPIPVWCHPPVYVAPLPQNVIFNNIHNTIIVDRVTRVVSIKDRSGTVIASEHRADRDGHLALAPALPPSIATRVALAHAQSPGSQARPTISPVHQGSVPLRQSLPDSHSLPPLPGRPVATPNGTSSVKPSPASPHAITGTHNGSTLSAFAHGGPIANVPKAPNPLTQPMQPRPPRLAARPPMQPPATASPSKPATARTLAPVAPPHVSPPVTVRSSPPAHHAMRTLTAPAPPVVRALPPAALSRPTPPPLAALHPTPPPVVHRPPPPVAAFRPPPTPSYRAPAAVVHAPAPVARAAPPPVARAAPAPPPGKRR